MVILMTKFMTGICLMVCFLYFVLPSPRAQRLVYRRERVGVCCGPEQSNLATGTEHPADTKNRRSHARWSSSPIPCSCPPWIQEGTIPRQPTPAEQQPEGPGQLTPLSGVAQINVSITPNRQPGQQNGYDFGEESYLGNQTYDRASPMVSTIQNPPAPLTANHQAAVLQNGGFRSRTRTSRQSLAFGRSSRASVRDTPLSYHLCPFLPGFLVISHHSNIVHDLLSSPLHLLPPSHLLSISLSSSVSRGSSLISSLFMFPFHCFNERSHRATLIDAPPQSFASFLFTASG
jgi:hypothetical protein